jgi:hypothetical protein
MDTRSGEKYEENIEEMSKDEKVEKKKCCNEILILLHPIEADRVKEKAGAFSISPSK